MRLVALLLLAAPILAQEEEGLVFGKDEVECEPIECEVRVPEGWKVTQDHTGIVAQGDGMGFVITREPLLEDEKEFAESWQAVLAKAGKKVEVKQVRAGRYRAFRAEWEESGRAIEIYRIHVPDQEYLYNVSFSFPKEADREPLLKGVLKSFKCTSDKAKLELQERRVAVGSATIQLPVGYEEVPDRMWRGGRYVQARKGYEKREEAGVIYTAGLPIGPRLPTGGTTSDPEAVNTYLLSILTQRGVKLKGKTKSKPASYGGLKGELMTGEITGTEGEIYGLFLWTGKGKRETASVILLLHEREMRLYKKYFSTVLKTLKASK